jgi:hypothetical protein
VTDEPSPPAEFVKLLEETGIVRQLSDLNLWLDQKTRKTARRGLSANDLWRFCRSFARSKVPSREQCFKVARLLRRAAQEFEILEKELLRDEESPLVRDVGVSTAEKVNSPAWAAITLKLERPLHPEDIGAALARPVKTKGDESGGGSSVGSSRRGE